MRILRRLPGFGTIGRRRWRASVEENDRYPTWSPDNTCVAFGEKDAITVFDVASGKRRCRLQTQTGYCGGISFSDDSTMVACVGDGNALTVWRLSDGMKIGSTDRGAAVDEGCWFLRDARILLSDGRVFDVANLKEVKRLDFSTKPSGTIVGDIKITADKRFAVYNDKTRYLIYDLNQLKVVGDVAGTLRGRAWAISDDSLCAAFEQDRRGRKETASFTIWRVPDGTLVRRLESVPFVDFYESSLSPEAKRLIVFSGFAPQYVTFFDTETMRADQLAGGMNHGVGFSADWNLNRILISWENYNSIYVHEGLTGRRLYSVRHKEVDEVAFGGDGLAVSGSRGLTICLWDFSHD